MTGALSTQVDDWGIVLRNGSGADNAQPQNGIGSAYVNDVFVRSVGKWASQLTPNNVRVISVGLPVGAVTWPITWAKFCALSGKSGATPADCNVWNSGTLWYMSANTSAGGHWCAMACFD